MTYHVRSDGKLNHLFDDETCACNGKKHHAFDPKHQFVTVGKLDAKKITCKKCLGRVSEFVMREMLKAIGGSHADKSAGPKHCKK